MAKAGLLYIGTDDGLITLSDPGGIGRWRRVGHTLRGWTVRVVLALDALHLLVVAGGGVQRSTNGGMQWQPVLDGNIRALAVDPTNRALVYALTAADDVLCSEDGGTIWQSCAPSAPEDPLLPPRPQATLPGKPDTLLAAQQEGETALLVRSDDGGATWEAARIASDKGGASLHGTVTVITRVGHHRDLAWAGTDAGQLLYTDDRGRTWQTIDRSLAPIRSLASARLA
jgi:photosystem II stability/assembly factor-like uncharacterized protein